MKWCHFSNLSLYDVIMILVWTKVEMLCSYLTENATVGCRGQLISLTVDGVPSVLKKNAGVKLEPRNMYIA